MSRKLFLLPAAALLSGFFAVGAGAQTARRAVSAAEVNGTFRMNFTGRFRGSANEIKILALGKNRLKMSFDLVYPFIDGTGKPSANVGQTEGFASIVGDRAVFTDGEYGECRITIKFLRPGAIEVTQKGDSAGCGFGFNVSASGTYRKASGAKPRF